MARGVERRRTVKHAAIVPDDQIVGLPLMAIAELRLGDVIEQRLQQRATFLDGQPLDVGGVRAEKEARRPFPGFARTSGWRTGGYSARSSAVKNPGRT